MPVQMQWDNEQKTVFRAEYIGDWRWEELYEQLDAANHQMDLVDHPVDIIHDWSKTKGLPTGAFVHARNLIPRMHPHTALQVHVAANSPFLTLWRVFSGVYGRLAAQKKVVFVETLAEARAVIAREHSSTSV